MHGVGHKQYQGCWVRASKSLQMAIQGHVDEYNADRCYAFGTPVLYENSVYIAGGYLTRVSPRDRLRQIPFVVVWEETDA